MVVIYCYLEKTVTKPLSFMIITFLIMEQAPTPLKLHPSIQ